MRLNAQTPHPVLVASPQIADIIRYDHTSMALNSGRLNLNISLPSLEDNDFNFPISARYNSTGFIPSKPEAILGLNWSLDIGGVIYREVKGIPDDTDESSIKGFLHLLKEKRSYDQEAIINNPTRYLNLMTVPYFLDSHIEANSDLYHFQFGEYSGKFMIGYNGEVKVVCENGGSVKVDLSEYNYFDSLNKSIFKITTDDGYQYYFGGERDNMEYAISYTDNIGNSSTKIHPSAFFLYKIVATNGRELNISYKKIPSQYSNSPIKIMNEESYLQSIKDYTVNFIFTGFKSTNDIIGDVNFVDHVFFVSHTKGSYSNYVLTKVALIDQITCGSQKIKFYYSPRARGKERYKNVGFTLSSRCGGMLDSMNIYYHDILKKKVEFLYEYSYGNNPVFFMKELIMLNKKHYKFSYNKTSNLPDPMEADLDYWNFWRGGIQPVYTIPDISIYNNFDYKYNSYTRIPNPECCDVLLLNKITYPTGGSAEIYYEPHTYSKKMDRVSTSSFKPVLINNDSDEVAGGARVSKISYLDSNSKIIKKIGYEYTNSKNDKRSSGILAYYPKYFSIIKYIIGYTDSGVILTPINPPTVNFCNTGLNIPPYEQDHIRYSTVREVLIENDKGGNMTLASSVADFTTNLTKLGSVSIEKNIGYWDIVGMKPNGSASIYLKKNGEIKATINLINDNLVRYVPNLESGDYDIYYQKTPQYGFYVKIIKPLEYEGSYKETKFTDYETNPDSFLDDKIYCEVAAYTPTAFESNDNRLSQDRSSERGRIASEWTYDNNGNLLESINNTYAITSQGVTDYTLHIRRYNGFMNQINKNYFHTFQLIQTKHQKYIRAGLKKNIRENVVASTINYNYNQDNLLKKTVFINSKNEYKINITNYSGDIQKGIYSQMQAKNILKFPVEKLTIFNNIIVKSELFTYKKNYNDFHYVLDEKYSSQFANPKTYNQYSYYDGNTKDECYTVPDIEYTKYDLKGNIIEIKNKSGIYTSYLWGYNNQFPIAKIENASYDEVRLALAIDPNKLSEQTNPDMFIINQLRSHSILKKAQITTYTYDPLRGITSVTSADGKKLNYTYDTIGRLLLIKDNSGKIISQYEYNYKQ